MSEAEYQTGNVNQFKPTPWLLDTIQQVDALVANQKMEFSLTPDIHPYYFISALGQAHRSYEVGGVYNLKTRSILMNRGGTSFQADPFGREYIEHINPRLNSDGTSDDLTFHTHPYKSGSMEARACIPSVGGAEGDDLSVVLNYSLIEKWDGYRRIFTSVIASGGYISVTESKGMEIDDEKLLSSGLAEAQIIEVKRRVGLYPSYGLENAALATNNGAKLFQRIKDFYTYCDTDTTVGYIEKYKAFEDELKNEARKYGISDRNLSFLIKYLREQEQNRRYVTTTFMMNKGFTKEQAELMQSMFGITTTVYKVDEGGMSPLSMDSGLR